MSKPYQQIKDFNNTRLLDVTLTIDGTDVGFMEKATIRANFDIYQLRLGAPKLLKGQKIKEFMNEIDCEFLEFTVDNFAYAIGVAAADVTTWNGSDTYSTYWTDVLASKQLLTFKKRGFAGLQAIRLDHRNVHESDVPVVMNTTGLTTYTEGTDYLVDYTNGVIWAIPALQGGSLTSEQSVRVKYKCTPTACKEYSFNPSSFSVGEYAIQLTGQDSKNNKRLIIYMPKAQFSNGKVTTSEDDAWKVSCTIKAVYDSTSTSYPMGYALYDIASSGT